MGMKYNPLTGQLDQTSSPADLAAATQWSPILAAETYNGGIVLKVTDWTGGAGTKPSSLGYIGTSGIVGTAASAVNVLNPLSGLATALMTSPGYGEAITDSSGNAIFFVTPTTIRHAQMDALATMLNSQLGTNGWGITDLNGNALIWINPTTINHPQINTLVANVATALTNATTALAAAANCPVQVDSTPGFAITDSNYNAIAFFRGDKSITPTTIATARDAKRSLMYREFGDLLAIFTMSQSLGLGYGNAAQPAISTSPLSFAYRFVGGVRIQDLGADIPTDLASVVPFTEQDLTISGSPTVYLGESPSGGIAWSIYQLLLNEDGIDLTAERAKIILGAPGTSGTSANSLYTGAAMTNYNAMIAAGKTVGEPKGLPFRGVAAMPYIQGEQDYFQGTDPTSWKATIRSIRDSAAAQNQTTTGRARTPVVFPYQIASHLYYSVTTPSLALALLELEAEAYFGRIVPTHNLARSGGDNLHLTVSSSHELGLRLGTQIKRRLIDQKDGAGIRAGQATASGGLVTIPISWITGSGGSLLRIDTANSVANYGFQMVDSGGNPVTIDSVIVNSKTIQLSYSSGTPTEWRYGWTGFNAYWGYGQIRDDDALTIVGTNGNVFHLYNWLPISKGSIT